MPAKSSDDSKPRVNARAGRVLGVTVIRGTVVGVGAVAAGGSDALHDKSAPPIHSAAATNRHLIDQPYGAGRGLFADSAWIEHWVFG
jgi:hypothetical protein